MTFLLDSGLMENKFKENLQSILKPKKTQFFSQEIYPVEVNWLEKVQSASEVIDETLQPEQTLLKEENILSDQQKSVMESLEQFAQQQLENAQSKIMNGVLLQRKDGSGATGMNPIFSEGLEALEAREFIKLAAELSPYSKFRFNNDKINNPTKVKVFFITDQVRDNLDESSMKDEFDIYFEAETSELFKRMISAMKLTPQEYILTSVKTNKDESNQFLKDELAYFTPDLIVTLGASATNIIMNSKQRLSEIHGKFFPFKINFINSTSHELKLSAVFHPDYLRINPSMKKSAWNDLQLIMKELGKI